MSWLWIILLGLVVGEGCRQQPSPPEETISLRSDHFLLHVFRAEDGSCWQLLTGGSPYLGESRRGHSLNGVAAIERECP